MSKLRFATAREVFEAFPSASEDIESRPTDEPPLDFVAKLQTGKAPEEAVSFCAYMLGRREAVWWACQSVRATNPPASRDEEKALLVAEAWVREPEEHRRRSALDIGMNGDHKTPAVWTSLAAGGSGGLFYIGEQPGPPVPPHLTAKAARAAVLMALAAVPTRERAAHIGTCVNFGRRLAVERPGPA